MEIHCYKQANFLEHSYTSSVAFILVFVHFHHHNNYHHHQQYQQQQLHSFVTDSPFWLLYLTRVFTVAPSIHFPLGRHSRCVYVLDVLAICVYAVTTYFFSCI
jgi:hypothetical protein